MKNLNPEFCKNVKLARREAGLTQGQLAAEVGCKQSALSMFEQGDGTKLNDEVIEKLAKKFNLSLTPSVSPAQVNTPPLPHSSAVFARIPTARRTRSISSRRFGFSFLTAKRPIPSAGSIARCVVSF